MPLFKFQIYATSRCVSDSPMYPTMPPTSRDMKITPMCPGCVPDDSGCSRVSPMCPGCVPDSPMCPHDTLRCLCDTA